MANHRRSSSVSHTRLSQPLPPLPLPLLLNDLPAYRDDPEPAEEEGEEGAERVGANQAEALPSEPPEYQPMYDYLRAHQLQHPPLPEPYFVSDSLQVPIAPPPPFEPYRDEPDEPFVVDIDTSQPPPPSYNDLYREHEIEMHILERTLDAEGDPIERTEDICKWIVAMLLITLTVGSVYTAFNWPHCNASMRC